MRLFLSAVLAASLFSGAAIAAEEDDILSDLVVVTATPRPADVKMVVQTSKPAPAEKAQIKASAPAQDAPRPIRTASQ